MADDQQVIDQPSKKIIASGYTFGTVTDQIASVVLTKKTPYVVMGTFAVAMGLLLLFLLAVGGVVLWYGNHSEKLQPQGVVQWVRVHLHRGH